MPTPTRKASATAPARPANMLNQIVRRLNGWLTSSSINAALLYKYPSEVETLSNETTYKSKLNILSSDFTASSSIMKPLHDDSSRAAAYHEAGRYRYRHEMTYFTLLFIPL